MTNERMRGVLMFVEIYRRFMKNYLLVAFLLFILNACSKDPNIDPRDQYIGDYDVIYTAVGTSTNGRPVTISRASKMTVVKGAEANLISLVEDKQYISATLSGSAFTLVPIVSPLDKNFVTTGSGTFTKNSFTMKTIGQGGSDPSTEVTVAGTKR